MTPNEWILGKDVGVSSKTIWAVMMCVNNSASAFGFDTPHDHADFGRCYRLLQHFPEWHSRLHEVAERFPEWAAFVREWDKMTAIYEIGMQSGEYGELCNFISELREEALITAMMSTEQ